MSPGQADWLTIENPILSDRPANLITGPKRLYRISRAVTVGLSRSVTKRQCPVWQVRRPTGQSRLLPTRLSPLPDARQRYDDVSWQRPSPTSTIALAGGWCHVSIAQQEMSNRYSIGYRGP
jgi:hypothetical protein